MAGPDAPKPAPTGSVPPPPPPAPVEPPPASPPAPKVEAKVGGEAKVSGDAPAPIPVPSPDGETPEPSRARFFLGGDSGFARVGSGDGNAFAHGFYPGNEGWHYTPLSIYGGGSYQLWSPNKYFQWWVGGQGGYLSLQGDKDAPGSLNGGFLGAHTTIGSAGLYADSKIFRGPEASFYFNALLMDGASTAGGHFSVKDSGGFGYGFKAEIAPVKIDIGDAGIQPYYAMQSYVIPNAREDNGVGSNLPVWAHTFGAKAVWTWEKPAKIIDRSTTKEVADKCGANEKMILSYYNEIVGTDDKPGLRTMVVNDLTAFQSLSEKLKKRGWDAKQIREAIVRGKTRVLEMEEMDKVVSAETEKLKKDKPDIKDSEIQTALKAKEPEFKKAVEAKKEDFKKAAEAYVAADYDHYDLKMPDQAGVVKEDLADLHDCAKREDIFAQLDKERLALHKLSVRIEERTKFLYFAYATPPKEVVRLVKTVGVALQFPPVMYQTGRPDYPPLAKDMARLRKFVEDNKSKFPLKPDDKDLRKALDFQGTWGSGIFASQSEINKIYKIAQVLNGEVPPSNVDTKKKTPEEIEEIKKNMRGINILIEGHTSGEGKRDSNVTLSNNRAETMALLLEVFGVKPERLRFEGFGPDRPLDPESDDSGKTKTGKALEVARITNRRIVLIIDDDKPSAAPVISDEAKLGKKPADKAEEKPDEKKK